MATRKKPDALDREIRAATARAKMAQNSPLRAVRVRYARSRDLVELELACGVILSIPACLIEGVAGAPRAKVADVSIVGPGIGVRWEQLDVDMKVEGLLAGITGSRAWMSMLGRAGGRMNSEAKRAAARANGMKGGRPRKQANK
jgi:hypothetical protein